MLQQLATSAIYPNIVDLVSHFISSKFRQLNCRISTMYRLAGILYYMWTKQTHYICDTSKNYVSSFIVAPLLFDRACAHNINSS